MLVQTCFSTQNIVNKNKNCVRPCMSRSACRGVYKCIMCVHKGAKYEDQDSCEYQMPFTLRLGISLLFATMYTRRVGL